MSKRLKLPDEEVKSPLLSRGTLVGCVSLIVTRTPTLKMEAVCPSEMWGVLSQEHIDITNNTKLSYVVLRTNILMNLQVP
jgi:hypothetical protein